MTEVPLAHLIAPSGAVKGAERLYSRSGALERLPAEISAGGKLDLGAHFNMLPAGTYRESAGMKGLFLELDFEGDLKVSVRHLNLSGDPSEEAFDAVPGKKTGICPDGDLIAVSLSSAGGAVLRSGTFIGEFPEARPVHLAHVVCTYRREDDAKAKHDLIARFLRDRPEMGPSYRLIIVDSGRTLSADDFPGTEFIPSPNYGGSAGFARGILRALEDPEATDILLNDDDAILEPEMIFRTIAFRSVLLPAYADAAVGGAMLLRDRPLTVHESGAETCGLSVHALKRGTDLGTEEGCLSMCRREPIDYFGWWYADFPRAAFERFGLPLPFFFKMDDAEFGTRLTDMPRITVPGISVWHPSFAASASSRSVYYSSRNSLAAAACRGSLSRDDVRSWYSSVLSETACIRYEHAEALLRAAEDFLRGPDCLFSMFEKGPEDLPDLPPSGSDRLGNGSDIRPSKHIPRWFRFITMNGLMLPPDGDREASPSERRTAMFYRAGRVLYIWDADHAAVCVRDRHRAFEIIRKAGRLRRRMVSSRRKMNDEYSAAFPKYSSAEWWESVFRKD